MSHVLVEGYTLDELLSLSDEVLSAYLFTNEAIVLRVGTAEILGSFRLAENKLIIELAQIDGGGEGVLPHLWVLANRYATKQGMPTVEWIVHAINCAKPNLKLRRLLTKRGFVIDEIEGIGTAYHLIHNVNTV